ncbi:MAG: alkaline phosphatase family protein [Actinomycetota bacterium]|nr:alkaline phosphatase family protein [Actinomycetota bacterium]
MEADVSEGPCSVGPGVARRALWWLGRYPAFIVVAYLRAVPALPRNPRWLAIGASLALLLAGCGRSSPPVKATLAMTPLCGFRPGPGVVDKVLMIFEENHDYSAVVGSPDAANLNEVAAACGLATNDQALTHPSLPNYLTAVSGQDYARSPFDGDCTPGGSCLISGPSIFGQEAAAGHSWRSYQESMPAACDPSDSGSYAPKHNPAVYAVDVRSTCPSSDLPLGTVASGSLATDVGAGTLPSLSILTPNLDHDMHDGTVATGDRWLGPWLHLITGGADYRQGRLAVLIVWDEGSGSGNGRSHVPLFVLSASTPAGTRDNAPLDHLALLRTAEELTGVGPPLAGAAGAPSFAAAFQLRP